MCIRDSSYFDAYTHVELMSMFTNDVDTLTESLNNSFGSLVSCSLNFLGTMAMMIVLSPILTGVTVVMLGVMLGVVKVIGGRSRRYFAAQQKAIGAVNGYIEEMCIRDRRSRVGGAKRKDPATSAVKEG